MSDLVEIGVEAMHEARAQHFGEHKPNRYEERGELYRAYMAAIITAIEKAGHRIVPVEPTLKMQCHGLGADMKGFRGETPVREIYLAMLAAAPKATT